MPCIAIPAQNIYWEAGLNSSWSKNRQSCCLLSPDYQGDVASLQFSFYSRPCGRLVLALFNGEEGRKGFERTY